MSIMCFYNAGDNGRRRYDLDFIFQWLRYTNFVWTYISTFPLAAAGMFTPIV